MTPRAPSTRLHGEHRLGLARATLVGGTLVPLFGALDWWLATRVYPSAHLVPLLLVRALMTLGAVVSTRVSKRERAPYRVVLGVHALAIGLIGAGLGVMAGDFGGLNSPYLMGQALVILIRSGAVPERFSVALGFGLVSFVMHFVALLVRFLVMPEAHAWWLSPESLDLFVANFLLTLAVVVSGAAISHVTWTAQQQIYEARRLGRFRLEAPLGRGGQNEVWLAWDGAERRQVALKILRSRDASADALALFKREAQLASQLSDPRTVRIYEFGASDDGVHYLAMEYLAGLDLSAVVAAHGPMPLGRALHVASELCGALDEAHRLGLVHRDVKPSNVMLLGRAGAFDEVKLLDFGIARPVEESAGHTNTGVIRGTPAYLAPECCRGEPATPASDLYGLGATLYFLLGGAAPFRGGDVQVLALRLTREPDALSTLRADLPADLVALVQRCLATDPRARFESAAALAAALAPLRERFPWGPAEREQFWLRARVEVSRVHEAATLA
ncbi:MAG: serine/threonine-protein kinase [Myxococcota bacterium]